MKNIVNKSSLALAAAAYIVYFICAILCGGNILGIETGNQFVAQVKVAQQAFGIGEGGDHADHVGIAADHVRQLGVEGKAQKEGQ